MSLRWSCIAIAMLCCLLDAACGGPITEQVRPPLGKSLRDSKVDAEKCVASADRWLAGMASKINQDSPQGRVARKAEEAGCMMGLGYALRYGNISVSRPPDRSKRTGVIGSDLADCWTQAEYVTLPGDQDGLFSRCMASKGYEVRPWAFGLSDIQAP